MTGSLRSSFRSASSIDTVPPSQDSTLPQEIVDIKDRFSSIFGSRVDIKRNNKGRGKIVIPFKSDREFNNIIDLLENLESE